MDLTNGEFERLLDWPGTRDVGLHDRSTQDSGHRCGLHGLLRCLRPLVFSQRISAVFKLYSGSQSMSLCSFMRDHCMLPSGGKVSVEACRN